MQIYWRCKNENSELLKLMLNKLKTNSTSIQIQSGLMRWPKARGIIFIVATQGLQKPTGKLENGWRHAPFRLTRSLSKPDTSPKSANTCL
jgi:hypothetical protein